MIAQLFVNHSVKKLEQMTGYIETCLDQLTEEQIWLRGSSPENAVGNLVMHLSGNLGQYIGHAVAGRADTRNRPAEFAPESYADKAALKKRLRSIVDQSKADIGTLTEERLAQPVATNDGSTDVLTLVYQVVGHFQQHTGQIMFATKLMTRHDLGFYVTPSPASKP